MNKEHENLSDIEEAFSCFDLLSSSYCWYNRFSIMCYPNDLTWNCTNPEDSSTHKKKRNKNIEINYLCNIFYRRIVFIVVFDELCILLPIKWLFGDHLLHTAYFPPIDSFSLWAQAFICGQYTYFICWAPYISTCSFIFC